MLVQCIVGRRTPDTSLHPYKTKVPGLWSVKAIAASQVLPPRADLLALTCYFLPCAYCTISLFPRGLKDPALTRPGLVLYMPKPPALRKQTEANLKKPIGELCSDGDVLVVTESTWAPRRALSVILRFSK